MKNKLNILLVLGLLLVAGLGCSGTGNTSTTSASTPGSTAAVDEKPIAIDSKALVKEYDTNELAADTKYKDKMLAVTGKVESIAETFGNVTVGLEGKGILNVMCSFEESERDSVSKLSKGKTATLVGRGEGATAGLYVGLNKCKVQ